MSSSPVIPREDHESLKQSEMFIHGRVNERECNLGGEVGRGEKVLLSASLPMHCMHVP